MPNRNVSMPKLRRRCKKLWPHFCTDEKKEPHQHHIMWYFLVISEKLHNITGSRVKEISF
jgi:hypothetical protein